MDKYIEQIVLRAIENSPSKIIDILSDANLVHSELKGKKLERLLFESAYEALNDFITSHKVLEVYEKENWVFITAFENNQYHLKILFDI